MATKELTSGLIVEQKFGAQTDAMEVRIRELTQDLANSENNLELFQEAIAELELALEDIGWQRLSGAGDREFSISGLRKLRRFARLSYLKNPLIRHGVNVQSYYVWGQGSSISCRNSKVDSVIQKFLKDPKNTGTFTGHAAKLEKDRELAIHGDLFLALFTNKDNGRVIVRSIFPDEITEIITNPEDFNEPWFYKREWSEQTFDPNTGAVSIRPRVVFYPDWKMTYDRDSGTPHPAKIADKEVLWDAPMYHVKAGGFSDQRYGVPEIYSALDWARAVKDDLEDYATVKKAQARFAWKDSVKGGKTGVRNAKTLLSTTLNADGSGQIETNPAPVTGATWIQAAGHDLTPIKTAGMVPSPDEGRRMWLMTAAGVEIPETILSGDADVGNYATAKSLDRPTELKMECRRTLWVDIYIDILNYVIDMSIAKPNGALADEGEEEIDEYTNQVTYVLYGDDKNSSDRTIDFRFPSILQRDALPLVQAIVAAATLGGKPTAGTIPDRLLSTLLMLAVGEDEVDPIIAQMYPGDDLTTIAGTGQSPPGINNPPDLRKPGQFQQQGDLPDMGDAPSVPFQGIQPGAIMPSDLSVASSHREGLTRTRNITHDSEGRISKVEEVYSYNGHKR